MISHFRYCALLILACTCGCSTIIEGRTQQIAIGSSPAGATCVVEDNGDVIATVLKTPGFVTIAKSKNDILIECSKEGYSKGKKKNLADIAITSLGNMAFAQFSFIGNAVDSASGAAHKYDSAVFVTLEKETRTAQIAIPSVQATPTPSPFISASQGAGQPMSPRAQALAGQLVQEIAQLSAAGPNPDGSSLIIPPHTQALAGQLVQEVAGLPAEPSVQDATP